MTSLNTNNSHGPDRSAEGTNRALHGGLLPPDPASLLASGKTR
jgi:hypothetical protein